MERAISYINVMPDTKEDIDFFVSKVLAEVEIREALPLLIKLTAMSEIVDRIKDGIKEQMLEEADLEGGKSFVIAGHRLEKKSRTTYYYQHCPRHEELKAELKRLEDLMKSIETPVADTETGEVIEPARRSVSEYIAVTLKKS